MASTIDFRAVLREASRAAEQAAQEWLANAQPKFIVCGTKLLDACGNAHIKSAARKGSKIDKAIVASGGYIEIGYSQRGRQEHGLHVAANKAAAKVLQDAGIPCFVWDYID